MKRLALVLAAAAAILCVAAPSSSASSRVPGGTDTQSALTCTNPGFLRDGNGAGDAASLPVGWDPKVSTPLFAVGIPGAWRWMRTDLGPVPPGEFSYAPLQNTLTHDGAHIWIFNLCDNTNMCLANDNGGAFSDPCGDTPRDIWAFDPPSGYWVNVGRSNDDGNWEILCNPGGGNPLTVGTRDSCTDYHEEWAFNQG